MNVRKMNTMSQGPNNFLNKEGKNKINYTRYILLEERKKKKRKKRKELHLNEIIANVLDFLRFGHLSNNCHVFTSQ